MDLFAQASGEQGYNLEALPYTGSDIGLLLVIGVLVLLLGVMLYRAVQRRLVP